MTDAQQMQLREARAHLLHAIDRAEYVRAALDRGDDFAAAEDCQRLQEELDDAKRYLTALDLLVNPAGERAVPASGL